MSSQPMISPVGDGANPFAPPVSKGEDPWNFGDPVAVAIRREHQKDEAYVRAMGIVNYAYALLFGLQFMADASYSILHAMRRIDAPWSARPYWSLILGLNALLAILGGIAGFGFRRLKRWAFGCEAILGVCWLVLWCAGTFFYEPAAPRSLGQLLVVLLVYLALVAPMMNLWDVNDSHVFEPEYKAVVEATPHIRLRTKLPLEPKLISALLIACAVITSYFSYRGW